MAHPKPLVSVVILTHRRPDLLERCLTSLFASSVPRDEMEVFVAANQPDVATESVLAGFGSVSVLRFEQNLGVEARNRAAGRARGRFVLFLDDDCVVGQDMVRNMTRCLQGNPGVGVVGPTILSTEQPDRVVAMGHDIRRVTGRVMGVLDGRRDAPFVPVPLVGANGMMVRRELFLECGGFPGEYFVFFEDSDLCHRIRDRGYAVTCCPDATMWHPERKEDSSVPQLLAALGLSDRQRAFLLARNRLIFMRRNRPLATFVAHLLVPAPLLLGGISAVALLLGAPRIAISYLRGGRAGLAWAIRPGRRPIRKPKVRDRWTVRAYYTALSWTNPIWWKLDREATSLLDVGCGQGQPLDILNRRRRLFSVGVDVFDPYLRQIRDRAIHNLVVKADALSLPFPDRTFDIVTCLQVIEHLPPEQGLQLLDELERVARRQVIVTTPNGYMPHPTVDDNPHQEHLSGWTASDMGRLGFEVERQGVKQLYGEGGFVHRVRWAPLRKLGFVLGLLFEALCLLAPVKRLANYYLVCVKHLPMPVRGARAVSSAKSGEPRGA